MARLFTTLLEYKGQDYKVVVKQTDDSIFIEVPHEHPSGSEGEQSHVKLTQELLSAIMLAVETTELLSPPDSTQLYH